MSEREQYDTKWSLSVYVPRASSMQLHTFMLGIDVARRALLLISTPPFRTSGAGEPAPKTINCILYEAMIPYGKCLVNYTQGSNYGSCTFFGEWVENLSRSYHSIHNTLFVSMKLVSNTTVPEVHEKIRQRSKLERTCTCCI